MSKKKMRLRTRAILFVPLFMLLTNALLGTVLTWQARTITKKRIDEHMLDIVNTAAAMLDGDVLQGLTAEDKDTPEYQNVHRILSNYLNNSDLDYIYYLQITGEKTFAFGIDSDPVRPGEFGAPFDYTDALYAASKGTPAVDDVSYVDSWGRFYSAFSPVFNSKGEVAAIVTADFNAQWYERQINQTQGTVILGCVITLILSIVVTFFLTSQFSRSMDAIKGNLRELTEDLDGLMKDNSENSAEKISVDLSSDDIDALGRHISELRDDVREYIAHANTQANNMITAMASDYRCVYHVNLDEDDAVCYRNDPNDPDQTPAGEHFPYLARFAWYAENSVTELYREGFLSFIDPDNIRSRLATEPIIAYRYLARRDGREYYEMIRMAGVRRAEDRDDHTVHAIGLGFTEIDAEMRETMARNEALAEALATAEEASSAKTVFLSNMSHEIRTPMNAIIGLTTLALHEEGLSDQTRDYFEKISASAQHLLGLINDILNMSRIESGKLVLSREEFSFGGMLKQVNTMVMSQCQDKGLHYECRMLSAVDEYYIGDDTKLKEVLINILSNAIKFTEAPGSVTLSVERIAAFDRQTTLRFRVQDTGIGIDKDYLPKIFDAFSQENSGAKNKFGSTGLGMAITKRIVEMMNGTIAVESEKGVGTTFTVTVTLRDSDRVSGLQGSAIDLNSLRVLVVDDEKLSAEHAAMVLGEAGIHADICQSGREALSMMELQHLKQEPYNLVLMDWKMPEMDGVEAAKQIRERYSSETTVLILTAYSWDDIMNEALANGVDGFLAKPLFASNVIDEFERIAQRNNVKLTGEKQRAEIQGRRVLLAEDMEINAEIMMDILSMEDVQADHAENGKIAVEMFEQSPEGTYAAILMDIRMPEMDGLEAADRIRRLNRRDAKKIPIIALTANAFDEDVQRSLQVGMNAHLTKPVEPENLFKTLEELVYEAETEA